MTSIVIVTIFSIINIRYQQLFSSAVTADLKTEEEKLAVITANLENFKNYTLLGIITSISCLISVIGQFVYNFKSGSHFPFDQWAKADFANAIINTVCFGIFNMLEAKYLIDRETKKYFDYL